MATARWSRTAGTVGSSGDPADLPAAILAASGLPPYRRRRQPAAADLPAGAMRPGLFSSWRRRNDRPRCLFCLPDPPISRLGMIYRRYWLYPRLIGQLEGRVLDIGCGIGDFPWRFGPARSASTSIRGWSIGANSGGWTLMRCRSIACRSKTRRFDGAVLDKCSGAHRRSGAAAGRGQSALLRPDGTLPDRRARPARLCRRPGSQGILRRRLAGRDPWCGRFCAGAIVRHAAAVGAG